MDKKAIRELLYTIDNKKYISAVPIDLVQFAIDEKLIERTPIGNFQLTLKGSALLNDQLSWENLLKT